MASCQPFPKTSVPTHGRWCKALTTPDDTERLVEVGDIDVLTRHVDSLVLDQEWDALVDVRDRCRLALERGKQLWPVAAFAEYRLALDAPGEHAARMLEAHTGRFALGPLAEVAASTHDWDELAPYAPAGPASAYAAHERVVRGENLSFDRRVDPLVLDIPLQLQQWEPSYPLAAYEAHRAYFPCPTLPEFMPIDLSARTIERLDDAEACRALVDLAHAWVNESNGKAEAVAVRGDVRDAISALGFTSVRRAEISPDHAMALMAWTGASGGEHGRRRGMASGRFSAWWALAAVAGLAELWPVDPDELGEAAAGLQWWAWSAPTGSESGWTFRLAVEDPAERLAWAVTALDVPVE